MPEEALGGRTDSQDASECRAGSIVVAGFEFPRLEIVLCSYSVLSFPCCDIRTFEVFSAEERKTQGSKDLLYWGFNILTIVY